MREYSRVQCEPRGFPQLTHILSNMRRFSNGVYFNRRKDVDERIVKKIGNLTCFVNAFYHKPAFNGTNLKFFENSPVNMPFMVIFC